MICSRYSSMPKRLPGMPPLRRTWLKKPYICKKMNVAELAFCEVRSRRAS
jgi:hypothetical protein